MNIKFMERLVKFCVLHRAVYCLSSFIKRYFLEIAKLSACKFIEHAISLQTPKPATYKYITVVLLFTAGPSGRAV